MAVTRRHLPERPGWDCLSCGDPWPCHPARDHLTSQLDRISLAMYAWDCLEEAVGDLPPTPPVDLFDRFIRWTR